jgi:hypothetical protein
MRSVLGYIEGTNTNENGGKYYPSLLAVELMVFEALYDGAVKPCNVRRHISAELDKEFPEGWPHTGNLLDEVYRVNAGKYGFPKRRR